MHDKDLPVKSVLQLFQVATGTLAQHPNLGYVSDEIIFDFTLPSQKRATPFWIFFPSTNQDS